MNKKHQGNLQAPRKINTKRSICNHIIKKLMETKDKGKKLFKTPGAKDILHLKEQQ